MNSMSTPMASPSTTGIPATGQHNDADVAFARVRRFGSCIGLR
jgi:hypothetical protein